MFLKSMDIVAFHELSWVLCSQIFEDPDGFSPWLVPLEGE